MDDVRPPIAQLLLAGFAALAVAFTAVATTVAVVTGPTRGASDTPVVHAEPTVDPSTPWSTASLAREVGSGRPLHVGS